jgi:hypothetical protein
MKEDGIIERMLESHELHLSQLEDRMQEFISERESDLSNSEFERSKVKIKKRIERYLYWYEQKVRQVEDSFQGRMNKRLQRKKNNANFVSK